jgi:hypothetical protein
MNDVALPQLSLKETAVMVILMAEARAIYNPDLETLAGFGLDGRERRRLNDLGLVRSNRQGRGNIHELTDHGWRMCRALLRSARPGRVGTAGGALYALLAGLERALAGRRMSPAEFFGPASGGESGRGADAGRSVDARGDVDPGDGVDVGGGVDAMIRSAYLRHAKRPGDWVGLAEIRSDLGSSSREDVDAALRRLAVLPDIRIIPIGNLKSLTQQDRDAAIRLGGELKHAMAIEGS